MNSYLIDLLIVFNSETAQEFLSYKNGTEIDSNNQPVAEEVSNENDTRRFVI